MRSRSGASRASRGGDGPNRPAGRADDHPDHPVYTGEAVADDEVLTCLRAANQAPNASSCRNRDALSCSMAVTDGPVVNDPADSESSLAHPPALAHRLAARHREEPRQRRVARGPGPQRRRLRPVSQVAKNEAQQVATQPVMALLRGNVEALQLDELGAILSGEPGHVSEADIAALVPGHVERLSVIEIFQQPQGDLRGGGRHRLVERGHAVPCFSVGADRKSSDRRHVRQCRPPDSREGRESHRYAAGWWRVAAPAKVAGSGDKREEGSFTSEAPPQAAGIEEFANFGRMSWALSAGQRPHLTGRPLENGYKYLGRG